MPLPEIAPIPGEDVLRALREHLRDIRAPGRADRVYKDECMYTFATPEHEAGLFVNMKTWEGVCRDLLELDAFKSGCPVYLWERHVRVPLSQEERERQKEPPKELAIGTQGGFQSESRRFDVRKYAAVAVVLGGGVRYVELSEHLPESVRMAAAAIAEKESAARQDIVATWREDVKVSKYAETLEQLPAGGKVVSTNPDDWVCEETGVRDNLWLNLSTGFIGSGRPIWDGEKNIGGNGSAMRHFEATGKKYPLVVKLGTITPDGADVYSYAPDEDDMVLDPLLRQHLLHWGIDMNKMEKTVRTMAEWQVDFNTAFEFSKMTESGSALEPVSGPGCIGLKNLGNTCYMNSIFQALFTVPELRERFPDQREEIYGSAPAGTCADSLALNLAKLGRAMCDGVTYAPAPVEGEPEATPEEDGKCVIPARLKRVVGKGHPEFSSNRQQDAAEFLQHFFSLVGRAERADPTLTRNRDPATSGLPLEDLFTLGIEERVQCIESKKVAYRQARDNMLALPISLDDATNMAEVTAYQERQSKRQRIEGAMPAADGPQDEKVVPIVPWEACLRRWVSEEVVEGYLSAALGRRTVASKSHRIASFPPYLLVRMGRYYVDKTTWTAKKLECEVLVPDEVDLESLRAGGPQPGEELQPEEAEGSGDAPGGGAEWDPEVVAQLTAMGFNENGVKRACLATNNGGAEACMEWVLQHMDDPDFNDPIQSKSAASAPGGSAAANPDHVAALCAMGFTGQQAEAALAACGGDPERVGDWLFSHIDDLDGAVAAAMSSRAPVPSQGGKKQLLDGRGRYRLVGFISHMGSNTSCGHYVCHLRRSADGPWIIYNDDKVAISEHPPRGLAYVYLFARH